MHPAFARSDHRPWPVPSGPWLGRQSWCDLLFAHWPVAVDVLRPHVPEPLQVQAFDGSGWLGVVPFRMQGVMLRALPDVPGISAFPELNLRTYVEYQGKPGVWFFSLDATQPLAVWAARRFFHLPYHHAEIAIAASGQRIEYTCRRRGAEVAFDGSYEPVADVCEARAGTLEHFLSERYCLYARAPHAGLFRTEVHHLPWPLQRARAEIRSNSMAAPYGIELRGAPLLHFARRVDVAVWAPERVDGGSA